MATEEKVKPATRRQFSAHLSEDQVAVPLRRPDGSLLGGVAAGGTLTITNARLTDAGGYDVVVTNNYGRAMSVTARLSVALPPLFQSGSARNGTLTMTWNGATGFTYRVQYKTNLTQLYWSNLGSPIFATDNIVTGYDVLSSDGQRFYRVALLP
jgi:hypothetical protein